ncbi:MAG: tetratricopeptide repeat protein [Acidobacteria bacterium]|nr:tetratricopeptide repeat protein [Acidobacteriota bacterium]MCB9377176.1 tetratricopeptide repeat protein [Holophagales bacterium]
MSDVAASEAISALFAEAVELPAGKRLDYVRAAAVPESVRREVASLLAAYEAASNRPEKLEAALAAAILGEESPTGASPGVDAEAGRRVGPYRLLSELGRGGMGVVYLAERADGAYEQQVALKLLPPALRSATLDQRLTRERQILARLEHPGIARLLDGGVAEHDEPYLVLEYVDGEPLTEWCDERRLGIRNRLQLFLQICDAVQYAHGHLVVHRDLKPSNILIAEGGRVKLLDFGIAKLLADEGGEAETTALTHLGFRPHTPGYAAPEQLRGEPVSVATDVYGLGVLLYELLCGRTPQAAGVSIRRGRNDWSPPTRPSVQMARAGQTEGSRSPADSMEIAAARGSRPDRLRRRLAGDLDTIALKALREEPAERYASVQELAEDVRRHLHGQPIGARPASLRYRAGKLVRRHWVGAAATALIVLAVLAGLAGTTWQARIAARERDAARAEAAKAEQVAEFLAGVFRQANPVESKGEEMTVREALDRGAERIERDLADQPVVRADLMTVLADSYLELGVHDRAEALITEALALRRRHLPSDHPDVAEALRILGMVRFQQGDYERAIATYRNGIALLEKSPISEALELAEMLNHLGVAHGRTGDYQQGVAAYERALAIAERDLGPRALPVGRYSLNLGTVLSAMREDDRALAAYQRALEIYEHELGPDHPYVAGALGNIGYIRLRRGDLDGLEEVLRRVLAIHLKAYGPVHVRVATSHKLLAELYVATGRDAEAIEALQQMLDIDRQALGENHPDVAYSLHDLGDLHLKRGRPDEALPYFLQAVAIRRTTLEADNPRLATSLAGLGRCLAALGRFDEAEANLRRALESRRLPTQPNPAQVASAAEDLAKVVIEQGRCAEARPLLDEAASIYRAADPPDDEGLIGIETLLARCTSPSASG